MGKIRVLNDLRVKHVTSRQAGPATLVNGKRIHIISGISTRKYYDSSSRRSRYNNIPGIRMDKIVSLAYLAICLYNIKERANFGQVKVLKVVLSLSGLIEYHITFEASSLGVASVFKAIITEQFYDIEIMSVWIKPYHSNRNTAAAKNLSPPPQQTLSKESLNDLAPYLSQCALAMYNNYTLHVKKDAVHDIPSLKVVKAAKLDAEQGNTYLVTFEASLRDESNKVETFEAQISVPTILPTATMEFKEIKMIKHE